jgi:predicted MFS family arabinose efflux permease
MSSRDALDFLRHRAFVVSLPVHGRDALGLGPRGLGLLLSMLGLGTLAGAAAMVSRLAHRDRLYLMTAGSGLVAASLVGLVLVPHVLWAGVFLLLLGIGTAWIIVPAHTVFQEETVASHLGRVISIALAVLALSQVSGMGLAAMIGRTQPASSALLVAAALCGFAALLLCWGRRQIHQLTARPVTPRADPVIHAGDQR